MNKLKTKKLIIPFVAVFISIIFIALIILLYNFRLIRADDIYLSTGRAIVLDPIDRDEWEYNYNHGYDISSAHSESAGTITAPGCPSIRLDYTISIPGRVETIFSGNDVTIYLTPAAHHKLSFFSISELAAQSNTQTDITGTVSPSNGSNIENSFLKIEGKTFTSGFTTISFSSDFGYDGGSFTLHNVTSYLVINAWYIDETFLIRTSAGTGGTITSSEYVAYGESKSIQITPDPGYVIKSVTVDGVNKGAISSYSFSNITSAHTISATFERLTYKITTSASEGGTITPSSTEEYGSTKEIQISPSEGYKIKSLIVDGNSITPDSTYTFSNITEEHSITAEFELIQFDIISESGQGGSISESTKINYGQSTTFTISPDKGYKVKDVLVDGVSHGNILEYTFNNVIENHSIRAEFSLSPPQLSLNSENISEQQYTTKENLISVNGSYDSAVLPTISAMFDGAELDLANITVNEIEKTFLIKIDTAGKPVSDTPYEISVTAITDGGKDSAVSYVKIINTKPTLSISQNINTSIEKDNNLIIPVSVSDINVGQQLTIEIQIDNDSWIEVASGIAGSALSQDIEISTSDISYGPHTLNIRAYDGLEYTYLKENNTGLEWNIIIPPPSISLTSVIPNQQYTINDNFVTFNGTFNSVVSPTISATFDGASVNVDIDSVKNTFTVKINTAGKAISETPYELNVKIKNDGGNSSCQGALKVINQKPAISISDTISSTVQKNSPLFIPIIVSDINAGQQLTIEIRIDNNEWSTALTATAGNIIEESLPVSTESISYGSHTFNVRVYDGFEYAYANNDETPLNWNIDIPSPTISLKESNAPDQQFTINDNLVVFNGTFDSVVPTTIKAIFDDMPVEVVFNDANKEFQIEINTANKNISDVPYELEVTALNDGGTSSCKGYVKIINDNPSINISDSIETIVQKDDDFIIPISATDINVGQELIIEVQIDNNEWTQVAKGTAGTDLNENIIISTTNISYGSHIFNVRAFDGFDYSYVNSDKSSLNWSIDIPAPTINLATTDIPDQQFTIEDNFVTFEGSFDSVVTPTVDAIFEGNTVDVDVDNDSDTFSIVINTANLPVSDTPYKLEVTTTNDGGTFSCLGFVKVINQKPSVIVPDDLTLSIEKGETLNIPITVTDINIGQPLVLEIQIDDGDWMESATGVAGQALTHTAEIDTSALSYKSHTFNVRAFDGIEYSYAFEDGNQKWEIPIPVPQIQIDTKEIPPQQYTILENNVVITGTYDSKTEPTISATFDESPVDIEVNNDYQTFTVSINTARKPVSDVPYNLEVTIENEGGASDCKASVLVVNTPPELIIPQDVSKSVKKGSPLVLQPIINDINIGQTITIEYKVDDTEWIKAIEGIAGEDIPSRIEVPTDLLDNKSHTIYLRAYDGIDYTQTEDSSRQFLVLGDSSSSITVTSVPNQQYSSKKNVVLITGKVSDPEGKKGTMTCNGQPVKVIWDTDTEGHFEMEYDTSGKDVGFIANLKFVYDAAEADVSTTVINSAPSIKVGKVLSSYPITNNVNIPCEISDINIGQELLIYYSIDGTPWMLCGKTTATGEVENISLEFPPSNILGAHKLRFMATDRYNYCIDAVDSYSGIFDPEISDTICPETIAEPLDDPNGGYSLSFVNDVPPLVTIKNKDQLKNIKSSELSSTTIETIISNTTKDEVIRIYMQVDSEPKALIKTWTSDGSDLKLPIPLPILDANKHSIFIESVNDKDLSSVDSVSVCVKKVLDSFEEKIFPELTIKEMNFSYLENQDIAATLMVKDSLKETDYIYYQINDKDPVLLEKIIASGQAETISVVLPSMATGEYTITFFAQNAAGTKSNDEGNKLFTESEKGNQIHIVIVPDIHSRLTNFDSYFLQTRKVDPTESSEPQAQLSYYDSGEYTPPATTESPTFVPSNEPEITSTSETEVVPTGVESYSHFTFNAFILIGFNISLGLLLFIKGKR